MSTYNDDDLRRFEAAHPGLVIERDGRWRHARLDGSLIASDTDPGSLLGQLGWLLDGTGGDGSDGRYPDGGPVEVRYPRSKAEEQGDRSAWPWLPGTIVSKCGPDEWEVCVEAREVARLTDGSPAPDTAPEDDVYHPVCFRDSSELRPGNTGEEV